MEVKMSLKQCNNENCDWGPEERRRNDNHCPVCGGILEIVPKSTTKKKQKRKHKEGRPVHPTKQHTAGH